MHTAQTDPPACPRPAPPHRRRPLRTRLHRLDVKAAPYALVAPFFLCFAAFGLFPLLSTAWISLHGVSLVSLDDTRWLGAGNYVRLLHDDLFWNALRNTLTIGVLSTVPQLLLALGLAHLLNHRLRGRGFLRIAMLAPYATSIAAAALVFSLLFGRDFGAINWLLGRIGVGGVDWEGGRWSSQIAVSAIVVWRWTGYNALIYLAAMQAVPRDLYETAALDGAGRWHQFRHVTLPSIRPTVAFTVLVSTIGATQLFGEPLLFGGSTGHGGGSAHQYQTLGLYLYDEGWYAFRLGRAAAVAWVMVVITLLIGATGYAVGRVRRAGGRG
ncbi:carbohydrate ABC transporter permease [Kitasatospora sp. NPDC001660]